MNFVLTVAPIAMALLGIGIILSVVRLALGPSLPDRVVALDMIGVLTVGFIIVFAIVVDQPVFIDAAIVLALIGFIGTVAFARYVEKGTQS